MKLFSRKQKSQAPEVAKSNVSIGRFTYGVNQGLVHEWGEGAELRIGSFCSIASGVEFFLGGNHRSDWITTYPFGHIHTEHLGNTHIVGHPTTNGDIVVGNDVWIGSHATIMSGITIGDGAIIATNSHVVKDVLPYEIVGGNPARSIKFRFNEEIIQLLTELSWWDLPVETIREIAPTLSQSPDKETIMRLISEYKTVVR